MCQQTYGLMNQPHFPISHDGLVLRSYQEADLEPYIAAVRESAESVGAWMPWCTADYSEEDARAWMAHCTNGINNGTAYELGVFCGNSGDFLGGCGLNTINNQVKMCNLGYWVRQSRQRQGIATRLVAALRSFGFQHLGLQRIEIVVAQGNVASEGVARKSGAVWECTARNRLIVGGVSVPAHVFSMVPEA